MKRDPFKIPALIMVGVVILLLAFMIIFAVTDDAQAFNRTWFDTTYSFERAIICLPDGSVVDGKCSSWLDFENSDQIQVKIDGMVYLTHISNVCLISE